MAGKSRPTPCFLDTLEKISIQGEQRWRSKDGRYYTWDSLHGEIEVFNRRGKHLGVLDAIHGTLIKPAVKGRTIDV